MSDKVISKISKKAEYDLSTIAGRVKWKREKLGWQANELAVECKVPPTSINMLEMGKVQQPRYLKLLAEKLRTTTDFLLYGESDETNLRVPLDTTLLLVDQDIRPDFKNFDYYVVKIKKNEKPFYSPGMSQEGEIKEIFIGHKK